VSKLRALSCAALLAGLAACGGGGGDGPTPPPPPPSPSAIASAGGESQSGTVGQALATPIRVRVTAANGSPLANISVSFAITAGGGSVSAASSPTGTDGVASTTWTLGPSAGPQSVSASVSQLPTPIVFTATAAAGPPGKVVVVSGSGQSARVRTALPQPLVARVTDSFDNPLAGVNVTFTPTGGGTVSPATAVTGTDGRVQTSWTLGATGGTQNVNVAVASNTSAAAVFSGTATLPPWTVMVFMAADNNLAQFGIEDLDEIEAAGSTSDVQVVVQAEFSPAYLQQAGCNASCFNRPNFNTFRYVVPTTAGAGVPGPNGTVSDIGNRNMTDPAQLREFITYAQSVAPAERYALILWNHGSAWSGLLTDDTSARGGLMSLTQLRTALTGTTMAVIDFDMCQMGGYETLQAVKGIAQTVVFSESNVPGTGIPYTSWLRAIQTNTTGSTTSIAARLVDVFNDDYEAKRSRSYTTKSAVNMSAFTAVETEVNTLAGLLRTGMTNYAERMRNASVRAQSYESPFNKDFIDLLDSLRLQISDATIQTQIDVVKSRLIDPAFLLRNRARNGVGALGSDLDVRRSKGLHILMPSGLASDAMPSIGPQSFASYFNAFSTSGWTSFMQAWAGATNFRQYVDLGNSGLELYLVWSEQFLDLDGDIDLIVLEPSGKVYIPAFGTVTPNGLLTGDSFETAEPLEGFMSRQFVERGLYKFYALLYADPKNYRPAYNVFYRFGTGDFSALYPQNNLPGLSSARTFANDAGFSFALVDQDTYSDLRQAARWTATGSTAEFEAPNAAGGMRLRASVDEPVLTKAQLDVIRQIVKIKREAKAQGRRVAPSVLRSLVQPPRK
jgi:hypothetical protein